MVNAKDPKGVPVSADAMSEKAFEQERTADVVAFYDGPGQIALHRPVSKGPFASEADFLKYLTEWKGSKKMLVVILSKWHRYSDPKQNREGFWKACKQTGFEQVSIQLYTSFGRPILRE